jgi:type 1 glutamine amidotransferase
MKPKQQLARRDAAVTVRVAITLVLGIAAATIGLRSIAADGPGRKARVLIVTGIDYPGHLWRQTAPALAENLRRDPRLEVFTVEDPNFLDSSAITNYQAIVLHFQNWQVPGPAQRARENLERFVQNGGGLMSVHFACGAWHDEWPQFDQILGRVWDPALRPHDPYGKFRVEVVDADHPVTKGFQGFETVDELYTCLTGRPPIRVLATAKSVVDQKDYPMAFVKPYGQGRVFLTTLGHDITGITNSAVPELMRRGCAWAAGLTSAIE